VKVKEWPAEVRLVDGIFYMNLKNVDRYTKARGTIALLDIYDDPRILNWKACTTRVYMTWLMEMKNDVV